MDSDGRESPFQKNANRSRSRSPVSSGNDDRRRGRPRNRSRERSSGPTRRLNPSAAYRRVYVANISFDTKWTDIKDLFREKVGDVTYVQFFTDESGKFRGCGVVEFKDMSSVATAVDVLHRYEYRGRKLVVKEDTDLERDKSGRLITNSGGGTIERSRERLRDGGYSSGGSSSDMVNFNTYGLSPQFLDSLGINGPLSSKVFVANLDFKVTTKKLSDVFKIAGKIVNVDLKSDAEGNSKGHGIVEYEHPVEAVQAISMFHGQKLFQRIMSVRMDRFDVDDEQRSNKLPSGLSGLGKGLGAGGQAIHLSGMGGGGGIGGGGGSGGGGFPIGAGLSQAALGMMGSTGFGLNPLTAAAAAMSAGLGTTNLAAMGLGAGFGATGLAGAAGLGSSGLGLGLGNSNMGPAAERGLLGNSVGGSLGGSLGSGLGLANSSNIGLGSAGSSALGFGLGGTGANNSSSGGLMGNMAGAGNLSGLGSNTSLAGGMGSNTTLAGGMGSTGAGLGGSGVYGDFSEAAFDRVQSNAGATGGVGADNFGTRSSDMVQVRNLPPNYSWQNLRDRFRDVGDVRYTEMKSRGVAVIRFNSERDAQRAVDVMNRTRIEGRTIEVQLY